jgi:hypothetical protein
VISEEGPFILSLAAVFPRIDQVEASRFDTFQELGREIAFPGSDLSTGPPPWKSIDKLPAVSPACYGTPNTPERKFSESDALHRSPEDTYAQGVRLGIPRG